MNQSNDYQIFINQTLQLAETIVIKSTYTAEALNDWVYGISGGLAIISQDPTTWKYYLNLAGEYHSTDVEMKIISMDTLEEIVFNKANLAIHRATAKEYQYGTRQYTELVTKFPDQEQLILGILYPVDIQTAIDAEDGTILSYPPDLIEENEHSLIPNLQEWINGFKRRWIVPGFYLTDDLYAATMLGIMYMYLVPAILVFRLRACNTAEAHSFHITQYLGSHGFLDEFMNTLTKQQALYFYRNIAYIERNVGKRDTFNSLVDHIMTERFIPLAEYTMKHDISRQPVEDYAEVIFRKKQLNLGITLDSDNKTTIEQILQKEIPLAPGNDKDLPEVISNVRSIMKNSASNVVATKALESEMVDDSNSSPWILSDVLFNEWLYLSSQDIYTAYVNIDNVKTGDKIPLTAKEAFILAMYLYAKSVGTTLSTIPQAVASRVQRIPTLEDPFGPTVDDIYSIVDHKLIERSVAVQALAYQPRIGYIISIEAFYNLSSSIYDAVQKQRFLIASQENFERRGMVQAMVTRIYADHLLELAEPDTSYETWLSDRNIVLTDFNHDDLALLFKDVVNQATGASLHKQQSLKEMQAAMVNMFSRLSSYGIQVITDINDTNIRKTDWPGIRLGKVTLEQNEIHRVAQDQTVLDMRLSHHHLVSIDFDREPIDPKITTHSRYNLRSEGSVTVFPSRRPQIYHLTIPMSRLVVTPNKEIGLVPRGMLPVVGMDTYLDLTSEQQQTFKDIYNGDYYRPEISHLIPLKEVVIITELLPFDLGETKELLSRAIKNTILGKTYPQ